MILYKVKSTYDVGGSRLTNEEKRRYKSSKRRRRQAVVAAETGRIVPIRSGRKKAAVIGGTALVLVFAVAFAAVYFFRPDSKSEAENEAPAQNKMLLRVVNRSNPLTSDYVPELIEKDGVKVCSDMADDLGEMLEAAEQSGIELRLVSGYVSYEEQGALFQAKLEEFRRLPDFSEVRAQAEAAKLVPGAGESEAQTGLLVEFDISDDSAAAFLERDCVKYGFVRRYTEEKEDITKIKPSRSLYRYVSKEHAVKLRSFGMCLEEYEEYLSAQGAAV